MEIKANDIMSDHVVVIYEDMLVRQVAHLMLRDRVSTFPVVNKDIGLTGIITMTDLFLIINKAAEQQDKSDLFAVISEFKNMQVGDVMSRNVVSITHDTSLAEIIQLMLQKQMHSFPVMEDGKIIGIVSRHDILNAIYAYD